MNKPLHPLRVAIFASSLKLGGAEKQALYMARALYQAGIDVRIFHLGAGGHFETLLRQIGAPVHQIYTPNRPQAMLARLISACRQMRPQIILAAQFGDLRYAIPAGRLCRAMVLGGIRSDGFYELNTYGRLARWMVRLAHGLVANSCRATQNLVFKGVNPLKIEVLPNVIDLSEFDRQSAQSPGIPLPSGRIIAAAVGSLQPCKRFDRFLEALALARRSEPALAGVIAGDDRGMKLELQSKAHQLGLAPHLEAHGVAFLGEVDRIPAVLKQAAFLVMTSDYEGFPNVILEGMAARLPILSTPAGDARLIVTHGKMGYLVEPDDIQKLAGHMVELAKAPAKRKHLGEAGRKCVEQEYNYTSLSNRLLAMFHAFAARQQRFPLCEVLESGAMPGSPGPALPGELMLAPPMA